MNATESFPGLSCCAKCVERWVNVDGVTRRNCLGFPKWDDQLRCLSVDAQSHFQTSSATLKWFPPRILLMSSIG